MKEQKFLYTDNYGINWKRVWLMLLKLIMCVCIYVHTHTHTHTHIYTLWSNNPSPMYFPNRNAHIAWLNNYIGMLKTIFFIIKWKKEYLSIVEWQNYTIFIQWNMIEPKISLVKVELCNIEQKQPQNKD